ncbi:MAG: FCD domain-containing protein [Nocardioidaceae bacterium]
MDTVTFDPGDPRLSRLKRLTAFETVRARIVLATHLNLLRPREMLPPAAVLAEAFGVSEVTVKRALVSLAGDGVVERLRGRAGGTRIAAEPLLPSVVGTADSFYDYTEEVLTLIDQRSVLECGLTFVAAGRITEQQCGELTALVEAMQSTDSWADYHRLDATFHRSVVGAAEVPGAVALHERILERLYQFFLPYDVSYLRESNEGHRALVVALRAGDAALAARLARAHVDCLRTSMFIGLGRAAD